MNKAKVIAVDLDGTFTLTDTLHESLVALAKLKPYLLLMLPFWFFNGKSYFKKKVADYSELDVKTLPYNLQLINWLREEKHNGKNIVLATAANKKVAQAVVNNFEIFDGYIASDININLKSYNKRNALQEMYGIKGYDYVGNSIDDVEVWAGACNAIVVNASDRVLKKASKVAPVTKIFSSKSIGIAEWLKAFRVHQWLKNLLLFVPLLAAHEFDNIQSFGSLFMALISFSLCASSIYVVNDLFDLESDRSHPRKKLRPFASATLSISKGVIIAPLLAGLSIWLGAYVSYDFLIILLIYLLLTTAYSFVLKSLVLVDCIILATLYTVRIIAGAAAVSVSLSFWLLTFSIFIFLSLALVKRYAELLVQSKEGESKAHGRGYLVSDLYLLQSLGISSGYISVLVIALYVRSEDVVNLYSQPLAIWLLIPILLFWISWVWLKSSRGQMHDDPIIFAAKDKISLLVAALSILIFIYAAFAGEIS